MIQLARRLVGVRSDFALINGDERWIPADVMSATFQVSRIFQLFFGHVYGGSFIRGGQDRQHF